MMYRGLVCVGFALLCLACGGFDSGVGVTVSVPELTLGNRGSFEVMVTNTGEEVGDFRRVTIPAEVADRVIFHSSSPPWTRRSDGANRTVAFDFDPVSLVPTTMHRVTFEVEPGVSGPIPNARIEASVGENEGNASATIRVRGESTEVIEFGDWVVPDSARVGTPLALRMTLTNHGLRPRVLQEIGFMTSTVSGLGLQHESPVCVGETIGASRTTVDWQCPVTLDPGDALEVVLKGTPVEAGDYGMTLVSFRMDNDIFSSSTWFDLEVER